MFVYPNLTSLSHLTGRRRQTAAVVSLCSSAARCYCWPGCGLVSDRFCGRKSTSLRQFPEPNRGGVIFGGGLRQRHASSCFYRLFKVACSSLRCGSVLIRFHVFRCNIKLLGKLPIGIISKRILTFYCNIVNI